jgi:hypothetical protein
VNNSSYFRPTEHIDIPYGCPVCVGDVDICASFHEHIDRLGVGTHDSPKDRCHAIDIGVIDACAVRDEDTSEIRVILKSLGGMTQSRVPAYVLNIRRTTIFKQELESFGMEELIFTAAPDLESLTSEHDQRGIP